MLKGFDGYDKVKAAIKRLKAFEPPDGYYVAFSGGKDSQCVYHLCQMAGVKFDAHYSVTSVDPPELIRFIRGNYPDVAFDYPRDRDGKVITMWNLIPKKCMPPTRMVRYCCEKMKETNGAGRVTVTGVRWAESIRRKNNQGLVVVFGKNGYLTNDENDESRRMVEQCYRTKKTLVNPIIDWEEEDVWEYLNDVAKVPHCVLYDRGYSRIGCIGCPMSNRQEKELNEYPKYRAAYIRAFERMLKERKAKGLDTENWKNAEDVMDWWLGKTSKDMPLDGQMSMDEYMEGT